MTKKIINPKTGRRLSPFRLLIALGVFAGLIFYGLRGVETIKETVATSKVKPWYAPYVDLTATPSYPFEQSTAANNHKNLVLAFIVSSKEDACTPTWGTAYTLEDAEVELDLDRRIARFRQQDGNIAVSFGGLINDELSVNCKNDDKLKFAYKKVIDRYEIDTIDLDLEGEELKNADSLERRAKVMEKLQKEYRDSGKELAIWLTLPVATFGLTDEGANAVSVMIKNNVDLAGVNLMTMDYGGSKKKDESMQDASERALTEAHRQLGILYKQNGITLSAASLWKKIGATPMIGQNDIEEEIFSLNDADGFNKFTASKGVARLSIWSANRDIQCGENYVNVTVVSDSCSGIKQDRFSFSNILSRDFDGMITANSSVKTTEDTETELKPDDPETSPYQVWTEKGTYLEGTKVVWHGNVYEAKWWNKGDMPDNPVLQSWQTPWQLIGPVMPGEKKIEQYTLPLGTYPEWSGTEIYQAGQRVLLDGTPYQAKWWTQGNSPAASTSNPDSSPWVVLSQEDIENVKE